ncbi:isoprenylcysteine carboxylmethyltransferase family protein [Rhizobium sp. BK251]|uniref:methyltransferase family protein n=1 Tax=Rhizobium sp. BK251 TaxID=2512125 RepID=UPI0010535E10|nr:isoprenylcysteine carboxylmethyltransferase family protein [Rhizobium sp. BK251]TCL73641.1 protein-S-isoprenylcysteine O-methyltransferase Ste14 [Rhizobium sp. BK251]
MNAYRSKPLNFPWPPILYGLAILAALILDLLPIPPLPHLHSGLGWMVGAGLVVLAVSLDIWAVKTLVESRTTILPHRCTAHLVTRGPFRYTRNPIYLGYTIATIAFGLLTGNSWFFVTALFAAITTTLVAIRCEEMHLLSRFGCEFEFYCRKTRRWI